MRKIGAIAALALASACSPAPAPEPAREPVRSRPCAGKSQPRSGGGHFDPEARYCLEEIRGAERAALEKFARKVAPLSEVDAVRVWKSPGVVAVAIRAGEEETYFSCHYHSETSVSMYCHFSADPPEAS